MGLFIFFYIPNCGLLLQRSVSLFIRRLVIFISFVQNLLLLFTLFIQSVAPVFHPNFFIKIIFFDCVVAGPLQIIRVNDLAEDEVSHYQVENKQKESKVNQTHRRILLYHLT